MNEDEAGRDLVMALDFLAKIELGHPVPPWHQIVEARDAARRLLESIHSQVYRADYILGPYARYQRVERREGSYRGGLYVCSWQRPETLHSRRETGGET